MKIVKADLDSFFQKNEKKSLPEFIGIVQMLIHKMRDVTDSILRSIETGEVDRNDFGGIYKKFGGMIKGYVYDVEKSQGRKICIDDFSILVRGNVFEIKPRQTGYRQLHRSISLFVYSIVLSLIKFSDEDFRFFCDEAILTHGNDHLASDTIRNSILLNLLKTDNQLTQEQKVMLQTHFILDS